jgi:hypothetical protein
MTEKQEKFVLARIAAYDERLKLLETRLQELDGCRVPGLIPVPVDAQRPDNQD